MELCENMYFNIFTLFIVDTTSILKLMFPTVYHFYLDAYFGGCVVVIIVTDVAVAFIYIFIHLFCFFVYLFILFFVYLLIYLLFFPLL